MKFPANPCAPTKQQKDIRLGRSRIYLRVIASAGGQSATVERRGAMPLSVVRSVGAFVWNKTMDGRGPVSNSTDPHAALNLSPG
jgi:hypothetical protein